MFNYCHMSKYTPKVSVIIAVYNAEKYIENCVRSLFGQTLDDLELIFVDDCSPDGSIPIMKSILEEYPNRKNQVKVIRHAINQGVSRTRQDGINAASGEYIIHCDPDDWVESNMYELLYQKATENNADMVICDYGNVKNDVVFYQTQKPKELTSISILESLAGLNSNIISGGLCNKLVKKKCYTDVTIPSDINNGEDVYFLFKILKKDLIINYINKLLYYYRDNPNSIVHTFTEESLKKDIVLIRYFRDLAKDSRSKRYSECCKSREILTFYWRVFPYEASIVKDYELIPFNYQKYIFLNKRISIYSKLLLFLSINGLDKQSKILMKGMSKLKRKIKRNNKKCDN